MRGVRGCVNGWGVGRWPPHSTSGSRCGNLPPPPARSQGLASRPPASDTKPMNVPMIVVRRVDGRLYPATWPNTPPQTVRHLQAIAHQLRCTEGLSYRQVVAAMMERYGERRSLGQVWKDVHRVRCADCAPRPPQPPDPAQRARVIEWR